MKIIIAKSKKWGDQEIKVDDDTYKTICCFNWSIRRGPDGKMYARRNDYHDKKSHYVDMHRVIMNAPKGKTVDHIDGDTLNNQKNNLRICFQSENTKNMKLSRLSTTGFKGVSADKRMNGRYTVFITHNYKHIFGGYYYDPISAAIKYNELAVKYHGEFARLNKIPQ